MEQIPTFTGIDVSKLTLDICMLNGASKKHFTIDNKPEAIKAFFTKIQATIDGHFYIGMENTGCYNYYLYQTFEQINLTYYVIPPIHLKRSLGLTRGKNDKIDAARIALFVETNLKNLSVYKPQKEVIRHLQLLLCQRDQRIEIKKQLIAANEQYQYMPQGNCQAMQQLDNELTVHIDKQIKTIESQIDQIISDDSMLSRCYNLITTIQGVGKVLGWNLLVRTGAFSNITEARKLACYAGVVPFEHSSGTSIRGKTRVSHFADKTLKKLLHLAAMSAIRLKGDLRDYYQRKVAEGKNKMSVLNAVRNKIVHRIYAVLKNQRPYQNYLPQNLVMS